MFRKSKKANSSDEELTGSSSRFWKTRSSDDLTKADRQNIDLVDRYLENRLEEKGQTWSERCDDTAVIDHFQEQLAKTPADQLESVHATHKQFWSDLHADRDLFMKQVAGVNGPSGNVHTPGWINGVLTRRGREVRSNKWPGVEVPNIDSQASPRFASLSASGVKHVKQPVSTAEGGKEQVCIIEQPVVIKEASKDAGLILLGVSGAVVIGVVFNYSDQLTKSVKDLLKKWFGSD